MQSRNSRDNRKSTVTRKFRLPNHIHQKAQKFATDHGLTIPEMFRMIFEGVLREIPHKGLPIMPTKKASGKIVSPVKPPNPP